MPRPPSHQDSGSYTPRDGGNSDGQQQADEWTFVPPAWLLGDTTSSKRPHGRLFKLQMQPVPSAIRDAIRQTIQTEEPEKEEQKARILRQKLQEQKRKQLAAKHRLESVREKKEQALKDVRQLKEQEAQKSLEQLEESLRSNFELEQEEQDQQWRQRVNEECEQEKKRSLEELEEKERKEDEEARAAKKGKLDKATQEEQEASATHESSKEEIEGLQKEVDTLNHNRLEIVWLLKQVIKAEEKQKAGLQTKPQARPVANKQA